MADKPLKIDSIQESSESEIASRKDRNAKAIYAMADVATHK
jgi:hypothetical protein